ncbi:hypothetical protein L0Y26_09330 [Pectobacterium aroidearum]|uniref:hypothetical protein n=1 Tax=Pectobacterium aroidearum TaxID=1201031 RepID=UPI0021155D21|nr:hypothetical protein [Pectobacterium aroidearum]UUE38093.1 hypothetical protein L0Y26_09330 [Pectobacterium aroidearum]UUE42468.1 hypothetical protein L0Y25_09330 [Pectobacterium aroidearum]
MIKLFFFIACIALAIVAYRRVAKRLRSKGWGSFSVLVVSLPVSFMAFVISIGITQAVLPADETTGSTTSTSAGTADTTPTTGTAKYKKVTIGDESLTYDTSNPLEVKLVNQIREMSPLSADLGTAVLVFTKYGVSLSAWNNIMATSPCIRDAKYEEQLIKPLYDSMTQGYGQEYRQSRSSNFPKIWDHPNWRTMYYEQYAIPKTKIANRIISCSWGEAQQLPEHVVRPKPELYNENPNIITNKYHPFFHNQGSY